MYHKPYVIIGLIILFAVAAAPLWLGITGKGFEDIRKELAKPKGDHCIEDVKWMRANHMELLNKFREMAIREGIRYYESQTYGVLYNASLNECFKCHEYKDFCERCHKYCGVTVYCWTCHTPPGAEKR